MNFILIFYFFALILSLIFLWRAGELSVSYSVKMADLFNLNSLFIGFVLISVSTGLPELSVIIASLFKDVHEISAGTILGSNVCDISLVLGFSILLYGTLKINRKEAKDSFLLLLITILSMALVFIIGILNWISGLILIFIYGLSITWLWRRSTKKEGLKEERSQEKIYIQTLGLDIKKSDGHQGPGRPKRKDKIVIVLKLLGSIILVLVSSELAVRFAVNITNLLTLSMATVGATIFAIGTSLPEITLSLNAMKKKEYALALGNSLGSVLEQGTLLIGVLAFFSKEVINIKILRSLVPFMFIPFGIITISIFRRKIGRIEAILMLLIFVLFLGYHLFWIR